jgi:hypothetical protein
MSRKWPKIWTRLQAGVAVEEGQVTVKRTVDGETLSCLSDDAVRVALSAFAFSGDSASGKRHGAQ